MFKAVVAAVEVVVATTTTVATEIRSSQDLDKLLREKKLVLFAHPMDSHSELGLTH